MAMYLPEDIVLFEILTKLPVKSLMRFKCVSKTWKTCISGDRYFIDGHRRQLQYSEDIPATIILYHKKIDDTGLDAKDIQLGPQTMVVLSEHFSIVSEVDISYLIEENGPINFAGSCEGLVCVTCDEFPERMLLWNPATRQLRQLPCPPNNSDLWCVGFGVDDVSGDWKIVFLSLEYDHEFPEESPAVSAHVFAKSDTVWRNCGVSGIKGNPKGNKEETPTSAVGALHWKFVASDGIENILSFDLNSEVLRFGNRPDCDSFNICKWGSSLAAFTRDYDDDGKVESRYLSVASPASFGEGLSWSKLLKLTPLECDRSFSIWREQLLMSRWDDGIFVLFVADPKARNEASNLKQVRFHFDMYRDGFLDVHDYVSTIIPVF